MVAQVADLRDYCVLGELQVEAPNFRMPRKQFTVWYQAPQRFKVEADGLILLPKLRLYPDFLYFLRDSVQFRGVHEVEDLGVKYFVLDAQPRTKRKFPFEMQFFIHAQRWTVERVVFQSAKIGKSEIRNFYRRYDSFWLPETTRVVFSFNRKWGGEDVPAPPPLVGEVTALTENTPKEFEGRMLIVFRNYEINTGLKEEIFQKKGRRN